MTSTTFRDPVDRDVSDTIFKRILGVSTKNYIGDEQLRFFLINSQRANARVPKNLAAHGDARRDAMRNATTLLRDAIDVVATIDELETQKNAFLNFFDLPVGHGEARDKYLGVRDANLGDARAASEEEEGEREGRTEEDETTLGERKWENEPTAAGQPLGHVHKIDYAEQGVDEREMRRLRRKFSRTNTLDTRLYALARALSVESPQLGHARTQKAVLEAIDAAKTKSEAGKKQTSERRGDAKDAREGRGRARARREGIVEYELRSRVVDAILNETPCSARVVRLSHSSRGTERGMDSRGYAHTANTPGARFPRSPSARDSIPGAAVLVRVLETLQVPLSAAQAHVTAFQGQPCSCAYWRHSRCPCPAARAQVAVSQGQPCSCAYWRHSRCPCHAAQAQVAASQGQPLLRAYRKHSSCPFSAA